MKIQKKPPEYSKQAVKFLNKQDISTKLRIKTSIEKIPDGDIIPYQANKKYSRLRVGDYRILFNWVSDEQIFIAVIDGRGQVYKKGV
ncbi:MAG: type II toxin-antitoxin system RelE/ParE family toxin [Defluviitaleaceae bacterium]|nr:type II toxin-antitoxin system RelE/ParE family toxin [Defluviitaleaceae bacterium]